MAVNELRPRTRTLTFAIALSWVLCAPAAARGQATEPRSEPLPDTIPIFPLADLALFPHSTQPFHVFEPRYREMVSDALAGDSIIGMVMLRPGYEARYEGRPPVYALGCAGIIVASELLPDGRYNIALRGLAKFRILGEDASRPYRLAAVSEIPERAVTDRELLGSRRRQAEAAVRVAFPRVPLPSTALPHEAAIDGLSIVLPLEPSERLELLGADGPIERAAVLVRLLGGGVRAELGQRRPLRARHAARSTGSIPGSALGPGAR